ncbi:MAG: hypothetical protein OEY93_04065 [Anaerolineae bacterium]|nr:hypothetical protein [Anaerolineae bacterium]
MAALLGCSGGGSSAKSGDVVDAVGVGLPDGKVSNLTISDGSVNFQVEASFEDLVSYYRNDAQSKGLAERTLLTVINDSAISIVFDGHASGKAVVIQMVTLSDGKTNVNIRLEDV